MADLIQSIRATFPRELREKPNWVTWQYEQSKGKVPYGRSVQHAKTDDASTWSVFDQAASSYAMYGRSGVGYVFDGDGVIGVDLDHCREDGQLKPWAQEIITRLHSYTEMSPSGTGVHVYVRGQLPGNDHKKKLPDGGAVELYDCKRFFTVTGDYLDSTQRHVQERQDALAALYAELFPSQQERTGARPAQPVDATDEELLMKARNARNGAAFIALYDHGDLSAYDGDHSRADQALCNHLAYWTRKDAQRIERLFSASALGQREKWQERADYRARTIQEAIDGTTEVYSGAMKDTQPYETARNYERRKTEPAFTSESLVPYPVLHPDALYGVAGSVVQLIEPHTESAPVAILAQFLTIMGNIFGRRAYYRVENDRHYPRLFTALVGPSGHARKGTSWGQSIRPLEGVADDWLADNIIGGLSSGEGVIHVLRDEESEPGKDKRLLVREGEFAAVLKALARDGNTLSAILRQAWDGDTLRTLTKNAPEKASGTHVSIIGHITQEELIRNLTATEAANGFGNRFLWICVKRARLLPFPSELDSVDFTEAKAKIRAAITPTFTDRRINFDHTARELWAAEYPRLTEGPSGLLGAMTNRAEAQVIRLALLYAMLDCSVVITIDHLKAALALWNYAMDSARFIFGDALGDQTADTILAALRSAPNGLTRTEISALFHRNKLGTEIPNALKVLHKQQLATCEHEPTEGRSIERWRASSTKQDETTKEGQLGAAA